jgi:hypothetical protein
LEKYKAAEISVACDQRSFLLLSDEEECRVSCLREIQLGSQKDIVPQASEETRREGVHVLIEEKPHAAAAAMLMSSAAMTSMAY